MKRIIIVLCVLFLVGCGKSVVTEEPVMTETTVSTPKWMKPFREDGYDDNELSNIETLLTSMGLSEVYVEEYLPNGRMTVVTARIFDSKEMQLNLTFEDHILIYANLTGIIEHFEAWSDRSDKLKLTDGLQGSASVEMYSDIDGGIMAILNWDEKTINKAK